MQPWFIATQVFDSTRTEAWTKYLAWSGLMHVDEIVSLDPMLCPTLLPEIKDTYWPHIVNEDFALNFFVNLDFLLNEISAIEKRNVLCVYRNPPQAPSPCKTSVAFEFLGYDLVDVTGSASALTNCGGYPGVFSATELSRQGLLSSHSRAVEVQAQLRARHPKEPHANCHVYAISRAVAL